MMTMTKKKHRRHTPEQIIRKLAEGNRQLSAGQGLDEVCRHLELICNFDKSKSFVDAQNREEFERVAVVPRQIEPDLGRVCPLVG